MCGTTCVDVEALYAYGVLNDLPMGLTNSSGLIVGIAPALRFSLLANPLWYKVI